MRTTAEVARKGIKEKKEERPSCKRKEKKIPNLRKCLKLIDRQNLQSKLKSGNQNHDKLLSCN